MVRLLTLQDRAAIEELVYRQERENLFLIESLRTPEKFRENRYWGCDQDGRLVGVAVSFGRWKSFVVAVEDPAVVAPLVDAAVGSGAEIETVPSIRRCGDLIMERLTFHGFVPRSVHHSHLLELPAGRFRARGAHSVRSATTGDIDALVLLQRGLTEEAGQEAPITADERRRIDVAGTMVAESGGRIVSKATAGARSRRFVQIVGVITDLAHRRRGYALSCVSALCSRSFAEGAMGMLLFARQENAPAQKLYDSLGFRVVDEFLLVEYR